MYIKLFGLVAFEGPICCWYIFCRSMLNKCCFFIFDAYVQYYGVCIQTTVDMPEMCNVCIPVLLVTLLIYWVPIRCIYRHSSLISVCELIVICGLSMAFEGHICCWHKYGYSMVYKVGSLLDFFYTLFSVICLHVYYIISAVGCTCSMWQAYMFKSICQ